VSDKELLLAVVDAIKASNADRIVCKDVYLSHSLREELLKWEGSQRDEQIQSLMTQNDSLVEALKYCRRFLNEEEFDTAYVDKALANHQGDKS